MTAVLFAEIGTVHAAWCQAPLCDGRCRATVKVGPVKAVAVLDNTGLTFILTADNGMQITLPSADALAIMRFVAAATDPATLPGGAR